MDVLINIVIQYKWQIVGFLDSALVVAYLASLNSRLARLASAAAKFRDVIYSELKGLYPIPSDWPTDAFGIDRILRKAFPTLQAAVDEYRNFIPWYCRWSFDRAWKLYRMGPEGREIDNQDYSQYEEWVSTFISQATDNQITKDNTIIYKDNFKKNVDRLLKYAKQT